MSVKVFILSERQIQLQSDLTFLLKSVNRFEKWDLLECVKRTESPLLPPLKMRQKKGVCACYCPDRDA